MRAGNLAIAAFAALGDATRRLILEKTALKPSAVGELARSMTVSRSAVSQHLRILKLARLGNDRPDGARRIYHLEPHGILAMRAWLQAHIFSTETGNESGNDSDVYD